MIDKLSKKLGATLGVAAFNEIRELPQPVLNLFWVYLICQTVVDLALVWKGKKNA